MSSILRIDRRTPFNPAQFIGEGWTIDEQDERSLALTEIDLDKVRLEDLSENRKGIVTGEDKIQRLKALKHLVRVDAKVYQTLWEHKGLISEDWKKDFGGRIVSVTFDGTILRNPQRYRYVLAMNWFELDYRFHFGKWDKEYYWLGRDDWHNYYPSAVLKNG